jgi:hypothetical protein
VDPQQCTCNIHHSKAAAEVQYECRGVRWNSGSPYTNRGYMGRRRWGTARTVHGYGHGHGVMEQHYNNDPPMNLTYRQQQQQQPPQQPPQQQMQMQIQQSHQMQQPHQHQMHMQEPYRRHGMENTMPTQAPILPAVGSHSSYPHQPPPPLPEHDYRKSSTISVSQVQKPSKEARRCTS